MEVTEMRQCDRKYVFLQHDTICDRTGFIGSFVMDMDTDGKGFLCDWNYYKKDRITNAFKRDFEEVVNELRFNSDYGNIIKDRNSLCRYCYTHMQSAFYANKNKYCIEFGVRADSSTYVYLFRFNPNKGEHSVTCYCYNKKKFDRHTKEAENGICFIDEECNEKFRIEDGEQICIIKPNGKKSSYYCRYIDSFRIKVGDKIYEYYEFAEEMIKNKNVVLPYRKSLPTRCYAVIPETNELAIIEKCENNYTPCRLSTTDRQVNIIIANEHNKIIGVNQKQVKAMLAGLLHGWDVPQANPQYYVQ